MSPLRLMSDTPGAAIFNFKISSSVERKWRANNFHSDTCGEKENILLIEFK